MTIRVDHRLTNDLFGPLLASSPLLAASRAPRLCFSPHHRVALPHLLRLTGASSRASFPILSLFTCPGHLRARITAKRLAAPSGVCIDFNLAVGTLVLFVRRTYLVWAPLLATGVDGVGFNRICSWESCVGIAIVLRGAVGQPTGYRGDAGGVSSDAARVQPAPPLLSLSHTALYNRSILPGNIVGHQFFREHTYSSHQSKKLYIPMIQLFATAVRLSLQQPFMNLVGAVLILQTHAMALPMAAHVTQGGRQAIVHVVRRLYCGISKKTLEAVWGNSYSVHTKLSCSFLRVPPPQQKRVFLLLL